LILDELTAYCPHCGEAVEILVDPSGGAFQKYTEDCSVCCSPFVVEVRFDVEGDPEVRLERE